MIQKIDGILEHIQAVEKNCIKLGKKLLEKGQFENGLRLIRLGRCHDLSKLQNYEFENLDPASPNFQDALNSHRINNSHHPESWDNGIKEMDDVFLAEMVCDCPQEEVNLGLM